jgi:hypothetical protein
MHSSLSLAVGYNRIVTHGGRRCNDVVAILAKDEAPSLCSTCRTPASILSSAALSGTPPRRGPSLCALCALRGTSGGETMTTPVGRVHLRETGTTPTVRGAPASIMGSELPRRPTLWGSGPSLCPTPKPQEGSYVQINVVYIRNIIPAGAPLPRRRSWAVWAGAMLNFAFTAFSEVRIQRPA